MFISESDKGFCFLIFVGWEWDRANGYVSIWILEGEIKTMSPLLIYFFLFFLLVWYVCIYYYLNLLVLVSAFNSLTLSSN